MFSERRTKRNLGFVLVTLAVSLFGPGLDPSRVAAQQNNDHQTGANADPNAAGAPAQGAGNQAFIPGEVLVSFRPGVAAARARATRRGLGATEKKVFSRLGVHHWRLPAGLTVANAVQALSANPNVKYAEPNYVVHADVFIPNDPQFDQLWGLDNFGQTGGTPDADIDAPEAWDISTGTGAIVVGVIDTGVDYTHEDLAGNMWTNPGEIPGDGIDNDGNGFVDDVYGYDFINDDGDPFDDNDHGTHISGTIGAVGNNGIGVVGVNWDVQIMALKFLSAGGSGSTAGAIAAVDYATMMRNSGVNIQLTSNSWGGGGFSQALKGVCPTHPTLR